MLFFNVDDRLFLYCEDFLEFEWAPSSVDLIVTSPPYNVGMDYGVIDDAASYREYLEFIERALVKCYELSKADGRACFNIPLDKNRLEKACLLADFVNIAQRVGWKYHATIIWNKGNVSRRTAWGSWMSASAPSVIAPVEVIVVLYKERWKKARAGVSDITRDEFIQWTNGLWSFSGEHRSVIGHPAPFPLELPKRCIKLFSYVGDVVLDPFVGSGTTLIAAYKLGRVGVGVEINEEYCKLAARRIKEELLPEQSKLSFHEGSEK